MVCIQYRHRWNLYSKHDIQDYVVLLGGTVKAEILPESERKVWRGGGPRPIQPHLLLVDQLLSLSWVQAYIVCERFTASGPNHVGRHTASSARLAMEPR